MCVVSSELPQKICDEHVFPDVLQHFLKKWKLQSHPSLPKWNFALHKTSEHSTNQAVIESKHPSFVLFFSIFFPLGLISI